MEEMDAPRHPRDRRRARDDLRSLLVSAHAHDWQSDPFSLGAYSYAPKGAVTASEEMARPVEDTLYFAGEHTDTSGHWGTVHAAMRSGLRAAQQLLNARERNLRTHKAVIPMRKSG